MREALLIIHFIGLAMGLGTSLGFMFLGMASSKMEEKEAVKFSVNTLALGRMGNIGIGLLIISGLGLMTPYWRIMSTMPLLFVKFTLVLVLVIVVGLVSSLAKKAKKGDAQIHLKKIEPLGKISLLTALGIVVVAVLNFS